jgi:hypothetical protein
VKKSRFSEEKIFAVLKQWEGRLKKMYAGLSLAHHGCR